MNTYKKNLIQQTLTKLKGFESSVDRAKSTMEDIKQQKTALRANLARLDVEHKDILRHIQHLEEQIKEYDTVLHLLEKHDAK